MPTPIRAYSIAVVPDSSLLKHDAEFALVNDKVEQHVSPEIAEARVATLKAMKEAEQGWQKAIDKIAERAGLDQEP
jgi:hypothetical protein